MKILVLANLEQQEEILENPVSGEVSFDFYQESPSRQIVGGCDVILLLDKFSENLDPRDFLDKPVFINSVIKTLRENNYPDNFNRINGWPGFLRRSVWEIVSEKRSEVAKIMNAIGRKVEFVKDAPGMVTARVISMIINEAFFAIGDNVSTKEEIEVAMKLGTGFPFGPFEWFEKIGPNLICRLLTVLSKEDRRYSLAPLLSKGYPEI